MNKNILSLDPMYSPLHERISNLYEGKKYALLSSLAMKIYLKGFDATLLAKAMLNVSFTNDDILLVKEVKSHYRAKLLYSMSRDLNSDELEYMAKFASVFNSFIDENRIDLVLIHNDLRWHHAIAIEICKKRNLSYLVTEQGLFRPYTTVIDNKGVNANSYLMNEDRFDISEIGNIKSLRKINNHNSLLSKSYFLFFLIIFKFETLFSSKLKYQHNDFSIIKYGKRFIKQIVSGAYNDKNTNVNLNNSKYVFVPLQLQDDTQILIHSNLKSNQEMITLIESVIYEVDSNLNVFFKKHPNDLCDYILGKNSSFVDGSIYELSKKSCLAITVNSSASIDIIKTNAPLLLLGDSIYNKRNVALKVDIVNFKNYVNDILNNNNPYFTRESRDEYIGYLLNYYSLHGAGFSYDDEDILRVINHYE